MRKRLSKDTKTANYKLENPLSFTMIIVYQLICKVNVIPCIIQKVCSVGNGKLFLTLKEKKKKTQRIQSVWKQSEMQNVSSDYRT